MSDLAELRERVAEAKRDLQQSRLDAAASSRDIHLRLAGKEQAFNAAQTALKQAGG